MVDKKKKNLTMKEPNQINKHVWNICMFSEFSYIEILVIDFLFDKNICFKAVCCE